MERWQLPLENPWSGFTKFTLLASLGDQETQGIMPAILDSSQVRLARFAGVQVGEGDPALDTLWIVDLPGAMSVAFGVGLSQSSPRPVSLVPTFQNWAYDRELIPASETLAAMLDLSPRPAPALGTVPVFLLDAWRLSFLDEETSTDVTDNRYALSPADLPSAEQLWAQGITRVVYVVSTRVQGDVEADDLNRRFVEYEQAGLRVAAVDLADLSGIQPVPSGALDWVTYFAPCEYLVLERATVLTDPAFYRLHRFGFGGFMAGYAALGSGIGHFHAARSWWHSAGG
jgi:hypothetical protein